MAWVTISDDDVKSAGLTGPELAAARTTALPSGVTDTLSDVKSRVTREVRGYVAGCRDNTLGDGDTIPEECLTAALARIVYELCQRIPGKALLTDQRKDANDNAIRFLEKVSACSVAIVQPETVSAEVVAGPGVELVSSRERIATRTQMSGL